MKNIIKKSITTIVILAMTLTLVLPMQTQAAAKVKLNKTNAVLTITDKKPNPTVQLKVTGTSKKVTWTTSNQAIATVSKTGKVTAKKKGSVKITAKVSGKKYTCNVTVADKRIRLNKTNVSLTITDKKINPAVQLKVTGTSKKVTWTSSNKKVATVNKNGKVVAKKKGTAVVSAKVNSKTYKCNVTVKNKHKHDYFMSSSHRAVCDLDGYIEYCCRICQDKYTVVLPALEHNYVEISQSVESTTGKSVTGYRCTKCDRTYRQYTGPRIDYKKYHIHCHCGMDFSNEDDYIMHSFYALVKNGEVNGHSTFNWSCCMVTGNVDK